MICFDLIPGASAALLELRIKGLHHLTGIKLLLSSGDSKEIASNALISLANNDTDPVAISREMVTLLFLCFQDFLSLAQAGFFLTRQRFSKDFVV